MFICITDSLFCTPETNSNIVNQLYFNNFFKKEHQRKQVIKILFMLIVDINPHVPNKCGHLKIEYLGNCQLSLL